MATAAYIVSIAVFALGAGVFGTVCVLAVSAVSALVRRALVRRRLERDRRDYEDWLVRGKLNQAATGKKQGYGRQGQGNRQ